MCTLYEALMSYQTEALIRHLNVSKFEVKFHVVDLVTNAELPIGVLSWIKDLILTERLYRTATRVLEKLVVSSK